MTYNLLNLMKITHICAILYQISGYLYRLKPEFTIVIFIHYKPRIAVAILDV